MQTLQFRYVFALTGLHFLFGGASLKAISVLFGNLPLKEGVPFGPRVVVRDVACMPVLMPVLVLMLMLMLTSSCSCSCSCPLLRYLYSVLGIET
jgi:hypothetical protein